MSEVNELKNILLNFIKEQKKFNEEQKYFNDSIDKKIDKVQYFLEETIASHTKMFFEEQIELKSQVNELNDELFDLRNTVADLMSQIRILQERKI